MTALYSIDFACNDPDNGLFNHKVSQATFGDNEIEPTRTGSIRFTDLGGTIRIHRQSFAVFKSRLWFGNWCWNRYYFTAEEFQRLLTHLKANGWQCTTGDRAAHAWFRAEGGA